MFIQTEPTPNPATLKFIPGNTVLGDGTADFRAKSEAAGSPLAHAPVRRRRRDRRFPRLRLHLRDQGRATNGSTSSRPSSAPSWSTTCRAPPWSRAARARPATTSTSDYDAKDEDTVKTIKELLDTRVRPAVANDGGDIVFHGFKDGVVFLHMRGACAGCPSSTATLRHGIENLLKHFCPDVQEVRPV